MVVIIIDIQTGSHLDILQFFIMPTNTSSPMQGNIVQRIKIIEIWI
jgi:hypothetical protein